ncbi:MAG: hypothetical protein BAJALOKI2v1_230029 [Promethearchaeota archaeon]|nr:MAG: hypothetical protein BAJALOKI2v1_230029 [Candidatus Lokiarchaeota archaeon]
MYLILIYRLIGLPMRLSNKSHISQKKISIYLIDEWSKKNGLKRSLIKGY